MKRTTYCIMAAALLTAGALLTTACSNEDDAAIENTTPSVGSETIQFTATLAPKDGASRDQSRACSNFGEAQPVLAEGRGDDGTTTRAITTDTDGGKEILNVAWAENEQIAVRYQAGATAYATTTATVTAVDPATGTATISATLTNPMDGGTVTFVYPATLANDACNDIDETKLLNQHGNLTGTNGISTLYDAATGSGTISVSAGTAVVSSKVTMTNRVCICKFHFTLDKGGEMVEQAFNNLKIYDGNGHVYTVTSDRLDTSPASTGGTRRFTDTDDIYVAMLPVSGKTVIFHYEQTVVGGKANYIKYSPNTTLMAGKFYRSLNLTLTKDDYNGVHTFKDLSEGSITAADGDVIYQSSSAATANTITIPDGTTVWIAGVNISATGSAGIICNGSANINLIGTNSVTSTAEHYPGIQPGGSGTTLTISGSGSLTATGALYAAGIGSGYQTTCGSITISGGTVNATGGNGGAGIGSGKEGTCSLITINGGTVNATGGPYAAGIGTGIDGHCGNINITTGVTSVTATRDNSLSNCCIGKGDGSTSTCGTVTIGGTVYYDGTNFLNGGETYLRTSPFTWPTP